MNQNYVYLFKKRGVHGTTPHGSSGFNRGLCGHLWVVYAEFFYQSKQSLLRMGTSASYALAIVSLAYVGNRHLVAFSVHTLVRQYCVAIGYKNGFFQLFHIYNKLSGENYLTYLV